MATNSLHLPICLFLLSLSAAALPENPPAISSNSILIALLDSRYSEFSELVEKALLLQTLEQAVINHHSLTVFAPDNEALHRHLHPEFKRFLLQPANINSLQTLLLHHFLLRKLTAADWPAASARHATLSHDDHLEFSCINISTTSCTKHVGDVKVVRFDSVVRPDGIIHGVEKMIVPKSVEREFNNRRSLQSIAAVKPEGAPDANYSNARKLTKPKKKNSGDDDHQFQNLSIYEAMAPGPSLAPAPAPGPGGPHHHFDGERQVKDFIETLTHYGGYNEMADILVNLTNLAAEMGRLISEGYVVTVLAPNDEAMAKLTTEQLSEGGAAERIVYYHIVPEYQTEESMYNAVRRFGTVSYDTLRLPHKIVAWEADGSVRFGEGENLGYLFDPDIYTDGRISVQGIDAVLFPPPEEKVRRLRNGGERQSNVTAARRGKLLEVACRMLGAFKQDSKFTTCKGK